MPNINHSGYINLKENKHIAYDLTDGKVTIHMYEAISEIDNNNIVLGQSFDNKTYAMFSRLPLDIGEHHLFPINYSFQVDWVIENYKVGSKFKEAIFSFSELQYFCPSTGIIEEKESQKITFKREQIIIKEFTFEFLGYKCNAAFKVGSKGKIRTSNSYMQAESVLCISFDETEDIDFIYRLYGVVDAVFSFICNRRNTDCTYMNLLVTYPDKTIDGHKIVDCVRNTTSHAYFYNKYREEVESEKIISKTFSAAPFLMHIDDLFALVAKDAECDTSDSATISIASMHPSIKRRRLIDLQQSLQITGAFEFYVRRYLPEMVEEKEHHVAIKLILEDVSKNKNLSKKARKLADSLLKNVVREPALEDKISKAYFGFESWKPLESCIDAEWISSDEVKELAKEANLWRNELAHSKRSYEPNVRTIKAVRLMEHLNYAIVLRYIGYNDEEIRNLLKEILEH